VAVWLSVTWLADRIAHPSGYPELTVSCDGGENETRFLVEQRHAELDQGVRRLTSVAGFLVYRIPIDGCEPKRISYCAGRTAYHLEFSPDGKAWQTLVRMGMFPGADHQTFLRGSCGFPGDGAAAARRTGAAYLRFSAAGNPPEKYPAIRSFRLEIDGPAVPEHFGRNSRGERVLASLASGLAAKLMIAVGVAAVILGRRAWKTPWRVFAAGALLWLASVAAKAGFALLANGPVSRGLQAVLPALPAKLTFWLYVGLLTGVFECGIFLLLAKPIRRRQWNWRKAASLGVGFGAGEAIALGVFAALATAVKGFGGDMTAQIDWAAALAPAVERLIAMVVHIAAVVMIVYALSERRWSWLVASFAYKSGIDAVAAAVLLSGSDWLSTHLWFVELALFGPFACAGLPILVILARAWPRPLTAAAGAGPP
jgi:uncharacterized membrane protein YhfC